jgi:predicted nucleotidyltransferase
MYAGLPPTVRSKIEEWKAALASTLGDNLVAILLTGGVARGDYRPGESDITAIVVVKDASFAKLDAISAATQDARYGARIAPTFLTATEIPGAGDAFPLLYDEVKRFNIVIHGVDPFEKVVVHDTHRRLRIEQELREAQVWLRRAVTDAMGAREAVGGSVARKIRQVRRPLAALLKLRAVACKDDVASVFAAAGARYGIDVSALEAPREKAEAAHDALTKVLAAAIADVEAASTGPGSLRGPQ